MAMRNRRFTGLLVVVLFTLTLSMGAAPPPQGTAQPSVCSLHPTIQPLLEQTSTEDWLGWVARLSGRDPVTIEGQVTRIETRYSYAMFAGQDNARAYEYVLERLREWYPANRIEEDTYIPSKGAVWKNLVLTLPGTSRPDEVIILSAHLDSTSENPERLAPGAEDNASGSAALLEAARLFRTLRFERTIRLIWFTGEEQGLLGSKAYVEDHNLEGTVGVINLDMYGYDRNEDGCFELHIGTADVSAPIGQCFQMAVRAFSPGLKVDAITAYDMRFSDHSSFWDQGIGAVEVLQNFSPGRPEDACGGLGEKSPYYHDTRDTVDKLNPKTGFGITRAALGAGAGLAAPVEACFHSRPALSVGWTLLGHRRLTWTPVANAAAYRIYRVDAGQSGQSPLCSSDWRLLAQTNQTHWVDKSARFSRQAAYRVEAVSMDGACFSAPSACAGETTGQWWPFLPWNSR